MADDEKLIEYEFTLPDGSKRHEFAASNSEVQKFMKMHGAVSAKPVKDTK